MTQEEKQLLLRDLCGRFPYRVMIKSVGENKIIGLWDLKDVDNLPLPYLRPMSSMTEEERENFWWNVLDMDWREDLDIYDEALENVPFPFVENGCGFYLDNFYLRDTFAVIDWLNERHFDYRGLIEKGLALEAPEGMYNIEHTKSEQEQIEELSELKEKLSKPWNNSI